jgi:hypothetical protein
MHILHTEMVGKRRQFKHSETRIADLFEQYTYSEGELQSYPEPQSWFDESSMQIANGLESA